MGDDKYYYTLKLAVVIGIILEVWFAIALITCRSEMIPAGYGGYTKPICISFDCTNLGWFAPVYIIVWVMSVLAYAAGYALFPFLAVLVGLWFICFLYEVIMSIIQ